MLHVGGTYVIAEAGVNHNGSLDMALRLVEAAAHAGANGVKFQTFKADRLVQRGAPKAAYQKKTSGAQEGQYEMLRRLELSREDHLVLLERCRELRIDFLSSPFDDHSLDFLVESLGLKTIKMGSGEVTNAPLLLKAARMGVDVILSTGMSTLGEVEEALACLAFGYLGGNDKPCREAFFRAYSSKEGQEILQDKVTLLHCTTEYPAPLEGVNLRAMVTMREAFGLRVGYSDHTEGIGVSLAAVALGAVVLEKHFTLDRSLPGPDHQASLEPLELADLVRAVRSVELALGSRIKAPSRFEWENRGLVRRSVFTRVAVQRGEVFTEDNLICKRPGTGLPPLEMWRLFGKPSSRDYLDDEMVED